MDEVLTVRRWRRYGADRLFVTQETGARVGSVDLQSGEVVVDAPGLEDGLRRAAQAWLRTDARADVTELVLPVPTAPSDALDAVDEAALQAWLGPESRDVPDGRYRRVGEGSLRGSSVRTRLERLADEGWHVLHDVPLGRQGDVVSHLLVGPAGIFTVGERPELSGECVVDGRQLLVDGAPVAALRVARLEAARVRGLLLAAGCAGVDVRGLLVVHANLRVDSPADPHEPLVVHRTDVPGVFRRMPARLDPAQVRAFASVAARRGTWSH